MIIADTNVLLRAALNDDPEQSRNARRVLSDAETIAVPLQAVCEFVWVMLRSYKSRRQAVASAVLALIADRKVSCDRDAIAAGLAFLLDGGDFADGVIEYEGRRLGGRTFVTFDRAAATHILGKGRGCTLLNDG